MKFLPQRLVLITEKDIGSAIFRLYQEGIYHVVIKKGEKVSMDLVEKGYEFLNAHGDREYYNIYEFHSFSEVDPEVREWMASPPIKSYTIADALVINGFPQKIIANFYVQYNKPVNPTKIFQSTDKAFEWIFELIDTTEKN